MSRYVETPPITNPLQARLRDRRRAIGLQTQAVAALAGLTPNELTLIERGWRRTSAERLHMLDRVLRNYERAHARIQAAQAARSLVSVQG